jgi:hypothetical protein
MTDDEIGELLARQPRSESLPHPPGTVAIRRRSVEQAGGDIAAVERWIGTRAGERRVGRATKPEVQPAGAGNPRWEGPFSYYVIPGEALVSARGTPRPKPSASRR